MTEAQQRETAKERKRSYDAARLPSRKQAWADRSPEEREKTSAYNRRRLLNPDFRAQKNEIARVWSKKIRSDRATWPRHALIAARTRAKTAGLPFDLRREDIVVPTHCPIRGVELLFGAGRNNPDNPSLDRIVPELGYVRGNVRVISYWANRIKCDCSDAAVFRRLADYVEGRL